MKNNQFDHKKSSATSNTSKGKFNINCNNNNAKSRNTVQNQHLFNSANNVQGAHSISNMDKKLGNTALMRKT